MVGEMRACEYREFKYDTLFLTFGEVYCGKCAAIFRSISVRAKKPKGGYTGQCVVEGCRANLRGKGLWEIFL